eukprot:TRINITY_DN291_c0_g2_i1.p1 TRINITY_DN291_c0_g2~~TRINITY_DN291_c0_g2_i1.p1  ORF type:complete len:416 (-),score=148.74 TRINITY_DN291_c0_g2_i1:82-1266(-)
MSEVANILPGANDEEKFKALGSLNHKQQTVWFLNAFWEELNLADKAEQFWGWKHEFEKFDLVNKAAGNGLDELNVHRFFEKIESPLTVQALRDELRRVGAIPQTGRPKVSPITWFFIAHFKMDWKVLIHASQGDNSKEIAEAQRLLEEVQAAAEAARAAATAAAAALRESLAKEADAKAREAEAKASEAAAKAREAEAIVAEGKAKEREAESLAAQAELEAALAELKAQEDAYNNKTATLTAKSEGGGVGGLRAKNELAQHLGEETLPLRSAKINQEAAVRKAERATKASAAAREAAVAASNAATQARQSAEEDARRSEAARLEAEQATQRSNEAKAAADAALDEAMQRVQEAETYLQEVKAQPGCAHGAIWWIERELYEAKKYMPTARGGIAK